MENLDNALAELASQLGISVSQLWDWMQGYGIQAYARAKIGMLASEIAVLVMFFVVMLLMAWMYVSKVMPRLAEHDIDLIDVITTILSVIFVLVGSLVLVLVCSDIPELVGWIVSPEGMVIEKLMEVL